MKVERIFGVPGEGNLDVVESLRNSKIKLILTRQLVKKPPRTNIFD
jgi:thiamine pyrophosphate-dependent acetolactate synthase large subunit-like protein